MVINLVILITFTLVDLLMLLGENWCWSLLGPKGLIHLKIIPTWLINQRFDPIDQTLCWRIIYFLKWFNVGWICSNLWCIHFAEQQPCILKLSYKHKGPSRSLHGLLNKIPALSMCKSKTRSFSKGSSVRNDHIGYHLAVFGCTSFTICTKILLFRLHIQQA